MQMPGLEECELCKQVLKKRTFSIQLTLMSFIDTQNSMLSLLAVAQPCFVVCHLQGEPQSVPETGSKDNVHLLIYTLA